MCINLLLILHSIGLMAHILGTLFKTVNKKMGHNGSREKLLRVLNLSTKQILRVYAHQISHHNYFIKLNL